MQSKDFYFCTHLFSLDSSSKPPITTGLFPDLLWTHNGNWVDVYILATAQRITVGIPCRWITTVLDGKIRILAAQLRQVHCLEKSAETEESGDFLEQSNPAKKYLLGVSLIETTCFAHLSGSAWNFQNELRSLIVIDKKPSPWTSDSVTVRLKMSSTSAMILCRLLVDLRVTSPIFRLNFFTQP